MERVKLGNEETRVAVMLSQGYTKKEIATQLEKSINTVNNQTRRVYEKTGSRNLADITRFTISRFFPNVDINKLLTDATRYMVVALVSLAIWYVGTCTNLLEQLQAALPFEKITNLFSRFK